MKKNYLKVLLFNLLLVPTVFGQERVIDLQNTRPGEDVEYCRQHKLEAELMKDPAMAQSFKAVQKQLAEERASFYAKSGKGDIPSKGVVYRIPVVFHILHNGGSENISRAQIDNAIDILNRDYARENADADNVVGAFQGMPADIEIEFVLATKAPNGACFSGVTRTKSALTVLTGNQNGRDQVDAIVAGNDVYNNIWPTTKYLNIYVAKDIGGAAGYTYRPNGSTSMYFSGIWVLQEYVGAIGTGTTGRSRTLTHEVGHWLDLPHVWGGTNNPGLPSNCSDDDDVDDTPDCIGLDACILNSNTCSGDNAYWGFDQIDNAENYMDYSYCSKMFTPGQATRMRTALTSNVSGRNNLWTTQNIASTGADSNHVLCAAEFYVDEEAICAGTTVNFTDASYNSVNGWSWSFPGGTPSTSTSQNPSVVYNTPGTYEVTLTATDGGTSQTTTKTEYITVLPAGIALPYQETFETYTSLQDPTSFFSTKNISGVNSFQVTDAAGKSGTKSVRLRNFGQPSGSIDELITNNFDLSNFDSSDEVTMSFVYASRKRNATDNEKLQVQLSKDCGVSFLPRKTISNNTLAPDVATTEWIPGEDDWIQVHVTNITSSYFVSNLQVKFQFTSDGGNNLYLDDINFYEGDPSSLGLSEIEGVNSIELFPNPADEALNVRFEAVQNGLVQLEVMNLAGQVVRTINVQATAGTNLVIVDSADMASGMYLMRVKANQTQKTMQFVVK